MADGDSERRVQTTCLMILAAVALAVALYWLRSVMVPFVLAAFAAVSLSPLLDLQVRHLRLPRMAALLTTGLFGLILLCALAQVRQFSAGEAGFYGVRGLGSSLHFVSTAELPGKGQAESLQ